MESIYIENYVKIPVEEKLNFLKSIDNSDEFKVLNQEIVFSEESIIFDFKNDSDVNIACNKFRDFFKDSKDIKVDKIEKMRNKASQIILKFDESKSQIRI